MQRRTLIRWTLSALAALPFGRVRVWAQATVFPGGRGATLKSLGATVLPASLGAARIDQIVGEFVTWVRDYREGAEMSHGYGATRLRTTPASPAGAFLRQLEEIEAESASRGGAFTAANAESRRAILDAVITKAGVKELPFRPDGRHVATDLMAHYFRGPDANDLCYGVAIGRNRCRTLDGSDQLPGTLTHR